MNGSLLRELLGGEILTAEGEPEALYTEDCLLPAEQAAVSRAVQKRRIEYGATRKLARALFAECGLGPLPLLNRSDRSPIWPEGYVGAITHTNAWCGVALAGASVVAGLGIDAESNRPMKLAIVERISTETERRQMRRCGHEPSAIGTLWFSAKESVYKCLFPSVQRFIGFGEVEVVVDFETRSFRVLPCADELRRDHGALVSKLEGRFIRTRELWITSCVLQHD